MLDEEGEEECGACGCEEWVADRAGLAHSSMATFSTTRFCRLSGSCALVPGGRVSSVLWDKTNGEKLGAIVGWGGVVLSFNEC